MPIRDYDLYIFDWDGTLSTSTALVRVSQLFKRRYRVGYIKKHRDRYNVKKVRNIGRNVWLSRSYSHLYNVYSMFYKPRLQPGALETLVCLKKRGKKIAIFSDSNEYRLLKEARRLGVVDHIDTILSADEINSYKPNPEGLLALIDKFKTKRSRTIYIGDMASDIMTARFAKVSACSVGNGVDPYHIVKEVKPDYLYHDLNQMLRDFNGR
jgi:HAD superfamily hydrolase (TIGR01509 family)